MIKLFIAAGFTRIFTQMVWIFFSFGEHIYKTGLFVFEGTAILFVLFPPKKPLTKLQHAIVVFFGVCVLWDMVEYTFLSPYEISIPEYINAGVALLATLGIELKDKIRKWFWKS